LKNSSDEEVKTTETAVEERIIYKLFDVPTMTIRRFEKFMEEKAGKKGWVALQMLLDFYETFNSLAAKINDLERRIEKLESSERKEPKTFRSEVV
jgi:hypothetical protein